MSGYTDPRSTTPTPGVTGEPAPPLRTGSAPSWGQPGSPQAAKHRPWSTVLLVYHAVEVAVGVVVTVLGMRYLGSGGGRSGDRIGGSLLVVGFVVMAVTAALVAMTLVARRRADGGRPRLLFVVGLLAAGFGCASVTGALQDASPGSLVVGLAVAGPYAYAGVATAQAARRRRQSP